MLMLRFRDLTIPDGETIRRHQAIIESKEAVWWGWIMRQHETFPGDRIVELSRQLSESGPQQILLYHSGSGQLFDAELSRISALPGGHRIRSPEMDRTPAYMHESVCPVWFELKEVHEISPAPAIRVTALPTLAGRESTGDIQLGRALAEDELLRSSGATLWEVEIAE